MTHGHAARRRIPPRSGGCNFAENPSLDARVARPQWLSDCRLKICADDDPDAAHFNLWKFPGSKTLAHDGSCLSIILEIKQQTVQLTLGADVYADRTFAFQVPARVDACGAWPLQSDILTLLQGVERDVAACAQCRPNRSALLHMRSLQALDGAACGASHREIAEVIFGSRDAFERWDTDSELRAQLRYLLRRGQKLVRGGYRQLLSSHPSARENLKPFHILPDVRDSTRNLSPAGLTTPAGDGDSENDHSHDHAHQRLPHVRRSRRVPQTLTENAREVTDDRRRTALQEARPPSDVFAGGSRHVGRLSRLR